MASSFTVNKGIEQPSAGSYQDTWATPANNDYAIIDKALGGVTQINVTGIASGNYALTLQQYQPPNLEFSGAMSGNLVYVLPAGVGGLWSVWNNTSGAYTLTLYYNQAGGLYVIPQGTRALIIGDGANLQAAVTDVSASAAAAAQTAAETYAAAQASTAQSNAETYAAAQAASAQSNAEAYAASQASAAQSAAIAASETYAAAQAASAQSAAIATSEAYSRSLYRAGTFNAINGVQPVTFSTPFASGVTPIVVTQWNYANPNVGWVTPGSISNTGFTYTNSNGGTCDYIAYVPN